MAKKPIKARMIAAGFYRPRVAQQQWLHADGFGVQKIYYEGHRLFVAVDYLEPCAEAFGKRDDACEKVLAFVAARKERENDGGAGDTD